MIVHSTDLPRGACLSVVDVGGCGGRARHYRVTLYVPGRVPGVEYLRNVPHDPTPAGAQALADLALAAARDLAGVHA